MNKKIINYLLSIVLLAYASFISYSVFSVLNKTNPPPPALIVRSEVLLNPIVYQGDELHLRIDFTVNQDNCNLHSHRVIYATNGQLVWEQFTVPQNESKIITPRFTNVAIPKLPLGNYFYKVIVSLVCTIIDIEKRTSTSQSYTYDSNSLPFTVVEKTP